MNENSSGNEGSAFLREAIWQERQSGEYSSISVRFKILIACCTYLGSDDTSNASIANNYPQRELLTGIG
jgi:hypothetical protein